MSPKKSKIMTHLINLQPEFHPHPTFEETFSESIKRGPLQFLGAPECVLFSRQDIPLFWSYSCWVLKRPKKNTASSQYWTSQSLSITIITHRRRCRRRGETQSWGVEKKHQNRQHNLQSSSLSLSSTAVRKVQKVLSQNVNYFIYVFNRLIDKSGSSGTVLFFSSSLPQHPENEEDTSPHNDKFKRERKKEMTEEKFFFLYHHHKSPVRRGRKKSTFIRVEILDGPSRPEM